MKYSKSDLIKSILDKSNIQKTLEAIARTPVRSDARDLAVKVFKCEFEQVATEMFKENIGYNNYGDDILLEVKVSPSGWLELINTLGLSNQIFNILLNEVNLSFEIGTKENLFLTINKFEVEEEKTILNLSVFFTGDERIDERIDSIIQSLRRKC